MVLRLAAGLWRADGDGEWERSAARAPPTAPPVAPAQGECRGDTPMPAGVHGGGGGTAAATTAPNITAKETDGLLGLFFY